MAEEKRLLLLKAASPTPPPPTVRLFLREASAVSSVPTAGRPCRKCSQSVDLWVLPSSPVHLSGDVCTCERRRVGPALLCRVWGAVCDACCPARLASLPAFRSIARSVPEFSRLPGAPLNRVASRTGAGHWCPAKGFSRRCRCGRRHHHRSPSEPPAAAGGAAVGPVPHRHKPAGAAAGPGLQQSSPSDRSMKPEEA